MAIASRKVTIKLHHRKNTPHPSNITRVCICDVWKPLCVCGVCALKQAVREMGGRHGLVFVDVKPAMISIIKEITKENDLGHATWHGFRRGRTLDVLRGLDVKENPSASMAEISESGGWKPGSSAIFNYIPPREANLQHCARQVMDESDTDRE